MTCAEKAGRWQWPPVMPSSGSVHVQQMTVVKPAFLPGEAGSVREKYEEFVRQTYVAKEEMAINAARNAYLSTPTHVPPDRRQNAQAAGAAAAAAAPAPTGPLPAKRVKMSDVENLPGMEYARLAGSRPLIPGGGGYAAQLQSAGLPAAGVPQGKIPAPAPTTGYAVFSMEHVPGVVTCSVDPAGFNVNNTRFDPVYPDTASTSSLPTINGSTRRIPRFKSISIHSLKTIDPSTTLLMLDGVFESILAPVYLAKSMDKNFASARVVLRHDVCISRDMSDTVLALVTVEMAMLDPKGTGEFTANAITRLKMLAIKQLMLENLPGTTLVSPKHYKRHRRDEIQRHITDCNRMRQSIEREFNQATTGQDRRQVTRQLNELITSLRQEQDEVAAIPNNKVHLSDCPADWIKLGRTDIIPDTSSGFVYTSKLIRVIPASVHAELFSAIVNDDILWDQDPQPDVGTPEHDARVTLQMAANRYLSGNKMFGINQFNDCITIDSHRAMFVKIVQHALRGTLDFYIRQRKELANAAAPADDQDWD